MNFIKSIFIVGLAVFEYLICSNHQFFILNLLGMKKLILMFFDINFDLRKMDYLLFVY